MLIYTYFQIHKIEYTHDCLRSKETISGIASNKTSLKYGHNTIIQGILFIVKEKNCTKNWPQLKFLNSV